MAQINEIDRELVKLLDFCDQNGINSRDFKSLVKPLTDLVDKTEKRRKRFLVVKCLMVVMCVRLLFWRVDFLKEAEFWQRTAMISLLPFWDWTQLYEEPCLVKNPMYNSHTQDNSNCNACQTIISIDKLFNVSQDVLNYHLRNDIPIIISDGAEDWSIMRTDEFWFENITKSYEEEDIASYPCAFETNLKPKEPTLRGLFDEVFKENGEPWFAHWENCDKSQTKTIRKFYQRPYFVPPPVDLGAPNWVLVSSHYSTTSYREVSVPHDFVIVAQIRGYNHIHLIPREPCFLLCPGFDVALEEGELLALMTSMWQLEYRPGEESDNLAFVIGGQWDL